MGGIEGQREGIEARRLAGFEPVIGPAQGQDRKLEALVLVEDDVAHRKALELRQQEGQKRGLAGAGHADDAGVPQVPDVGAEPEGVSTVERNRVTASPQ